MPRQGSDPTQAGKMHAGVDFRIECCYLDYDNNNNQVVVSSTIYPIKPQLPIDPLVESLSTQ